MMAVQLAVRGNDRERSIDRGRTAAAPGADALASEAIGVRRCFGLERCRRRQSGVVEDDDDRSIAPELDPIWLASIDAIVGRLPRREDREVDAGLGERPQGRQVDRRLGQPHAGRTSAEPGLEVANPPGDLGPAIGG